MNDRASYSQDESHRRDALGYRSIFETVRSPLLVLDDDLRVEMANLSFCRKFHVDREDVEGDLLFDLAGGRWDVPELRKLLKAVHSESTSLEGFELEREVPSTGLRILSLNARRISQQENDPRLILLGIEDVTEQRRRDTALQDTKQFAENIVDTIRHPLLVLNGDLRVQAANRSFYRAFRTTPEETDSRLVYDLGNGQWDIPELRSLLTEILPRNTSLNDFDVEHDFASIGRRYMRLNARRMYREGNHTELILLAIEDVTEQRLAEQQRREAETRFTSLVKNIKDHSIFAMDTEGRITSWNVEAEKILGFSEHEAIGEHFSIIFTAEDRQQGIPQQELDAAREAGRAEDERWHRRADGERFWALGIVTPTTDDQGKHNGFSKILRDITHRKRTEEALRKQSSQLRMLWDSAADLLSATDPKVMMQKIFQRISEQLDVDAYFHFVVDHGRDALRLVSSGGVPEHVARSVEQLEYGETVGGTVALRGEPITAGHIQQSDHPMLELVKSCGMDAYACYPLISEDRLIGTLSFASRRVDQFVEEELAFFEVLAHYVTMAYVRLRLVEQLRDAHHRKDEFLAMLAHELRNPLAPIRSGLDLLAVEEREYSATVELMQGQMTHVVRLVDDLMDVSRIMRGTTSLRREPVEVSPLVQQSVETLRPLVDSKQQELIVSLPEEPTFLHADPVRLVQVLENLLSNASKYTDAGGRIEVTAEQRDATAVITVRDTGVGIDSNLLPNVFELFAQSARSLERSEGGLGIGLTLVKRLVELHGGTVSAHSEGPGHGSTFFVRLPVTATAIETEEAVEPPAPPISRHVVVVDDHEGATWLLSKLLKKLGDHQIEAVHDGGSALAKIREVHPDIVLLDIGLPGMDGYEVGRAVRQMPELDDVLLVALTGYSQEEDRRKSKEAGFDEHLTKPASIDQIKAILAHPKLKAATD